MFSMKPSADRKNFIRQHTTVKNGIRTNNIQRLILSGKKLVDGKNFGVHETCREGCHVLTGTERRRIQ